MENFKIITSKTNYENINNDKFLVFPVFTYIRLFSKPDETNFIFKYCIDIDKYLKKKEKITPLEFSFPKIYQPQYL